MEHITDLNRERNQQIINQAKEINNLLLSNNITLIFLKRTGNLLEGLNEDIAEKMVGDIDCIASKDDYMRSVNILKNNGYYSKEKDQEQRIFHWHYANLIKENRIASVEVHHRILDATNNKHFDVFSGEQKYYTSKGYSYFKNNYKLLNTVLPKILNDDLYISKTITLRIMYDVFLISNLESISLPDVFSKSLLKKILNYISCMELVFGIKFIEETSKEASKKYIKKYLNLLKGKKLEKIKNKFFFQNNFLKIRLKVILKAFYSNDYRVYALKRIFKKELYKNIFNNPK